jgi:hypothetical protein
MLSAASADYVVRTLSATGYDACETSARTDEISGRDLRKRSWHT